jgi:hypothetical protein
MISSLLVTPIHQNERKRGQENSLEISHSLKQVAKGQDPIMRTKVVSDIIFTQWLHDKFCGAGSPSEEFSKFLVNSIIINYLDVDIVDLDQMYDDILKFLRLNASTPELVDFFRQAWLDYKESIAPRSRS